MRYYTREDLPIGPSKAPQAWPVFATHIKVHLIPIGEVNPLRWLVAAHEWATQRDTYLDLPYHFIVDQDGNQFEIRGWYRAGECPNEYVIGVLGGPGPMFFQDIAIRSLLQEADYRAQRYLLRSGSNGLEEWVRLTGVNNTSGTVEGEGTDEQLMGG